MQKIINIFYSFMAVCIVIFTSITVIKASPKTYGEVIVSKIVNVYDGDTFHADIDGWPDICGKNIGIRVSGIDTPEMHDKDELVKLRAIKAKSYARNILETANEIKLVNMKRDKYFRINAEVKVDGHDFSQMMLDSGFAKKYDGGTKEEFTAEEINKIEHPE